MAKHTVYHPGGFKPAQVAQNRAEEWDDVVGTYTRWDTAGVVVETRPLTSAESARFAEAAAATTAANNETSLTDRARQALASNATFLNLVAPTNAQNAAQVKALTRQVNALIRLAVRALDSTDGT